MNTSTFLNKIKWFGLVLVLPHHKFKAFVNASLDRKDVNSEI